MSATVVEQSADSIAEDITPRRRMATTAGESMCAKRRLSDLKALLPCGKDPSLVGIDIDDHVGETSLREQVPMFVGGQHFHAGHRQILFGEPRCGGIRTFVHLGNDRETASGFKNAVNFAAVGRQIRPPKVRLDGSDQIECARREWHLGYGRFTNLETSRGDCVLVQFCGKRDARAGEIDAVNLPLSRKPGKLVDGSSAAATDVEDREVLLDGYVRKAPIGDLGVSRVHVAQDELTNEARWLLALRDPWL